MQASPMNLSEDISVLLPMLATLVLASLAGYWRQNVQDRAGLQKLKHLIEDEDRFDLKKIDESVSERGNEIIDLVNWLMCGLFLFLGIGGGGIGLVFGIGFAAYLLGRKWSERFNWTRRGWKSRIKKQLKLYEIEGSNNHFHRLAWALGMSQRKVLRRLGIQALLRQSSPEKKTLSLEEGRAAGNSLMTAMQQIHLKQWRQLPQLENNHVFWQHRAPKKVGNKLIDVLTYLTQDESIPVPDRDFLQGLARMQSKQVGGYCKQHRIRAEKAWVGELQLLQCPTCGDAKQLIFPIKEVVGQINGTQDMHLEEGRLLLQVWDAEGRKINLTEVDLIEVFPGKTTEWALAAFLEDFSNHYPNARPKIKLVPGVELSSNTQKMLMRMALEPK